MRLNVKGWRIKCLLKVKKRAEEILGCRSHSIVTLHLFLLPPFPYDIFLSSIIYVDLLLPEASTSIRATLNYITHHQSQG